MTVSSEITRIRTNIADAYTAASNKGASLPATENSDNLASCIDSISGSGGYSEVPNYSVRSGVAGKRSISLSSTTFSPITSISDNGLEYAFLRCTLNGNLTFPSLTSVGDYGLSHSFQYSGGTYSVSFPSLTTVGSYGFDRAFSGNSNSSTRSGLTGAVDLSSVTTIG